MPPSAIQIKEKVLQALDEESNIVNPGVFVEVIGILERVALTKEDLQVTRLGRYINDARKKTTDQDIAKRCRKLVRAWQKIADSPPSNNASPAPGYSPAFSTARRSPAASAYASASPQLVNNQNRHSSPALQPVKARIASPVPGRVASPAGRLVSPLVRVQASSGSRVSSGVSPAVSGAQLKRISPSNSRLTTPNSSNTPRSSASPGLPSSQPGTPGSGRSKDAKNVGNRTRTPTPTNNNHSNFTPNVDSTNRTHAGNKKRRRSDESNTSDVSSVKKPKTIVNGDINSRLTERPKSQKVKTTVELIAELQAAKSTRLTASDTITKIVTNQIQKEEDDINISVVPASAKPRFRRKNGSSNQPTPPAAPADLSKTKSDLVHRFLQQVEQSNDESNHAANGEDADVDILGMESNELTKRGLEPVVRKPVIDLSIDPYSLLPPLNYDEITWSDEEVVETGRPSRNAITGEYPDGYEHSISSDENPDERIIEKVVEGEWDGVNGTVSVNNQFHPWTETFTVGITEDIPVHVLPYVDI